jgi:hypothetical protein
MVTKISIFNRRLLAWMEGKLVILAVLVFAGISFTASTGSPSIQVALARAATYNGSFQEAGISSKPFTGTVFVRPSQYSSDYTQEFLNMRPLNVRAIATGPLIDSYDQQVQMLAEIDEDQITETIGFSSYLDLEEKLSQPGPEGFPTQADYLHSIGVIGFTYNSEISGLGAPRYRQELRL